MSETISIPKQNLWEFPYGIWLPKHDPKLIGLISRYITIHVEPSGYHMLYFNGYRVRTPRESGSHPCYNCGHCIDNGLSSCSNKNCIKDRKNRKLCDGQHWRGRGKTWIHEFDSELSYKILRKKLIYLKKHCKQCRQSFLFLQDYLQEEHIREYYRQEQFSLRSIDVINQEINLNRIKKTQVDFTSKIKIIKTTRGAYGELRHLVYQRDNYKCRECGATKDEIRLEIDHIIPWVKGGKTELDNLQTLCRNCNHSKHTRIWVGGQ